MVISWIAAFKLIPWSDVVQATPTVVRGARELWGRARKNRAASTNETDQAGQVEVGKGGVEHLAQRVAQLESEQLEASALISALAEQNSRLAAALDNLHARMKAFLAVCALLALMLASAGVLWWLR